LKQDKPVPLKKEKVLRRTIGVPYPSILAQQQIWIITRIVSNGVIINTTTTTAAAAAAAAAAASFFYWRYSLVRALASSMVSKSKFPEVRSLAPRPTPQPGGAGATFRLASTL
jgi:hypothetical protein